ncbi:MAG: hypothetical protein OXL41_06325 [Nitrospinae bacterium]|nr:hypothetical protein [Nitrospinota bacterium]
MTEKIKRLIHLAKEIGAENLDVEDWDYLAAHLTPRQWRRFIDAETLAKTP